MRITRYCFENEAYRIEYLPRSDRYIVEDRNNVMLIGDNNRVKLFKREELEPFGVEELCFTVSEVHGDGSRYIDSVWKSYEEAKGRVEHMQINDSCEGVWNIQYFINSKSFDIWGC